ncbi:hypothetical protein Poli38472_011049 [Pythium oligandrum]|uniref:GlcNac transferase n=1 Tax=Pythium oligandrum TaxID=41045 RepID=A0A8K1CQK4_PYTOL|nr:hypothetical protein Poli38472_011049 [Pythium oligandrum]|eukprot:TMW67429.1 hypothetical protein Poli38472_011049 [Pythium oligandrum]
MRVWSVLAAVLATALVSVDAAKDKEEVATIHVLDAERKEKVDPTVQHIPLNPALAHLRPPPARVPNEFDIFIGLSVFRDGHRCAKTMFTGFTRAKHPDRLYFGVVDQVNSGDQKCIEEFCKMAAAEWPDKGPCHYRDHIRIDERSADDSRGPTLARHYQQKLVKDEEFCLQLDGHSIFTNLWDENLLAEWKRIDNEMAVLTTYLHHLNDFIKDNGDNNPPSGWLPHLCTTTRGGNGLVRNVGASMISGGKFPQMSALWGAGLSFGKCHAERRSLIDSHTLWMFDGEEFLRASSLWTHGYDLYSPSGLGSVVYHNYSKVPARFEHVKVDQNKKKIEVERGINRFHLVVGKPFKGEVDTFELDKFAYGNVRSFQTYLNFSGVTFEEGKNDTDSCRQLHWVPYEHPEEVEQIVGGGWKMNPVKETPVPPVVENRKPKEPVVVESANDKKANVATGDAATADTPGEGFRFRQEISNRLPEGAASSGSSVVIFVLVLGVLFVALSNDSVSTRIRRQFRAKASTNAK